MGPKPEGKCVKQKRGSVMPILKKLRTNTATKVMLCPTLRKFVKQSMVTKDDPAFILAFEDEIIRELVEQYHGNLIPNLPPVPHFLAGGMETPESFKAAIIDYLRAVGGGHSCANIICPNTQDQYTNIQLRLRDIELNPFMQALSNHAQSPLGRVFRISNGRTMAIEAINRIAPEAPFRQIFE